MSERTRTCIVLAGVMALLALAATGLAVLLGSSAHNAQTLGICGLLIWPPLTVVGYLVGAEWRRTAA